MHSIREGMAVLAATVFEAILNPLIKLPETISTLVSSVNNGSGSDPILGESLGEACAAVIEAVATIGNSLQPVGYALCFLFFLIALLELAMSERMTLEYFIKFFSKFVVGFAAVYYWRKIYDTCRQMGPALAETILAETPDSAATVNFQALFVEYVSENGAASWLILIFATGILGLFLLLATLGVTGAVYVIVFTWMLELAVRGAFLPIACALLSDDGWRGSGGRYIRRFLAVCCQGAAMVCVSAIYSKTVGTMAANLAKRAASLTEPGSSSNSFTELSYYFVANKDSLSFIWGIVATALVILALSIAVISVITKVSSIISDVFGG